MNGFFVTSRKHSGKIVAYQVEDIVGNMSVVHAEFDVVGESDDARLAAKAKADAEAARRNAE